MDAVEVLRDGYGRVHDVVHHAVDGLGPDELDTRLDPEANSITWLIWHLSRVQDDHVADVAGTDQVWTSGGWQERFGPGIGGKRIGYGDSAADVGSVRDVPAEVLLGYFDAVHEATLHFLDTVTGADLDRVVDAAWDPPVTLGVRLLSVISDDLQHGGQAAFIRGVVTRAGPGR